MPEQVPRCAPVRRSARSSLRENEAAECAQAKSAQEIGGVSVRAPDLRMSRYDFYSTSGGKIIGLLGMDILGPNGSIIDFSQQKLYFYPLR